MSAVNIDTTVPPSRVATSTPSESWSAARRVTRRSPGKAARIGKPSCGSTSTCDAPLLNTSETWISVTYPVGVLREVITGVSQIASALETTYAGTANHRTDLFASSLFFELLK